VLPPLLADVNVVVQVVAFLRAQGVDVETVVELAWERRTDDELLAEAYSMRRFVLTHDPDFGRLAVAEGHSVHGILHLRPGDDPPDVVIEGLRPLLVHPTDWTPPMIAVYRAGRLRVRRPPR